MAKFKCIESGNTVEFTSQLDIDSMKGHTGYIRLDETPVETVVQKETVVAPKKTMGRPPKSTLSKVQ